VPVRSSGRASRRAALAVFTCALALAVVAGPLVAQLADAAPARSTKFTTASTKTLSPTMTAAPTPTVAATSESTSNAVVIEAERMLGAYAAVNDSAATSGTAVRTWALTTSTPVGPGTYMFEARVQAPASRVRLTLDGDRVAERGITSAWTVLRAPVHLDGTATIGVAAAVLPDGTAQPILVDYVALSPTAPTATTRGTRTYDAAGAPFTMRGVNRTGLEHSSTGFYLNDADASAMRQWGANTVRIQLNQNYWLPTSCYYDLGYAARVDGQVASVTSKGMVALLDLHRSSVGFDCKVDGQQKLPDTRSLDFWRSVAARYKDNPLVAFDLYNEPHDVPVAVWRDGGTITERWGQWAAVGMQQLYDTVRAAGATNLVVVSGLMWGLDLNVALAAPLDGYGIVYSAHAYCEGCADGALTPGLDGYVLNAAATWPVVVGEFGDTQPTGSYSRNFIAWAEAHGVGWLAYAWAAGPGSGYELLESWTTYAPNVNGIPVRDALSAARTTSSRG
jgi:hypothetical protein